jgi:hypothetical protein
MAKKGPGTYFGNISILVNSTRCGYAPSPLYGGFLLKAGGFVLGI